jgi:hypothetical protein
MKSSRLRVLLLRFGARRKSPTFSNVDFTMGHQSTDLPLPENTAGTGFGRGFCERQSRQVGIRRSFE